MTIMLQVIFKLCNFSLERDGQKLGHFGKIGSNESLISYMPQMS